MKNLLINIGKKSKKAFSFPLSSKKKDKVLKDYFYLIKKNKRLILNANKKDIVNAHKKKLKENSYENNFDNKSKGWGGENHNRH